MKKIEAIIFDMDGTLYSFDKRSESQFRSSAFGKQIQLNCLQFIRERLHLSLGEAKVLYEDLHQRYSGEVSIAVEKEFGIDRSEYFAFTWDLNAQDYISENQLLLPVLQQLTVFSGVLTAAPSVWAERALAFLNVRELFGEAVFTGEPDIRKPNPDAFLQLARFWNLKPSQILSIGDQEESDILPAKYLGMKTLRIASEVKTSADFMAPDIIVAIALLKEKGIV